MRWITIDDYFGPWDNSPDATEHVKENAESLLIAVNELMDDAFSDGIDFKENPITKNHVSGFQYGGFRPHDCAQGSANSSHKTGEGVDVYDKGIGFAQWCFKHQEKLAAHGLYMEHPIATAGASGAGGWCHLTTRAPGSGKRVFYP